MMTNAIIIAFLAGGAGGCVYFVRSLVKLDEKLTSLYWGGWQL